MAGSGRTQGRPEGRRRDESGPAEVAAAPLPVERGLLDDVDGLLDEIDAVLEDNAEEFVRSYVQKGGE